MRNGMYEALPGEMLIETLERIERAGHTLTREEAARLILTVERPERVALDREKAAEAREQAEELLRTAEADEAGSNVTEKDALREYDHFAGFLARQTTKARLAQDAAGAVELVQPLLDATAHMVRARKDGKLVVRPALTLEWSADDQRVFLATAWRAWADGPNGGMLGHMGDMYQVHWMADPETLPLGMLIGAQYRFYLLHKGGTLTLTPDGWVSEWDDVRTYGVPTPEEEAQQKEWRAMVDESGED